MTAVPLGPSATSPLVARLLNDRERALGNGDWGLVREIDAYLARLGWRPELPVVETTAEAVPLEDTSGPRPARNARR